MYPVDREKQWKTYDSVANKLNGIQTVYPQPFCARIKCLKLLWKI